ncbi:MAG TPA: glycosyltransferase family 2 protein [bacterium]|nr:glycosyltransferase family 2 protein [bacterium]
MHTRKGRFVPVGETMSRGKVSVIIPARKEPYIRETLRDLYAGAVGDIEVILVLDGDVPDYELPEDKRLRVYYNSTPQGLRPCLNAAISMAKGKYILKMDAHCTIGEGWDKILKADCEDNWVVIPRRYWFDATTWSIKDMPHVDAMRYPYPFKQVYRPRLTGRPWPERAEEHKDEMLTEDLTYQGSMWFMQRKHWNRIGCMNPSDGYGTFGEEPQEIGFKTQLGPWEGKVMRNKNTWYAHWSKPSSHWQTDPEIAGRVTDKEFHHAIAWAFDYWWFNRWEDQAHDIEWLIDRFWPLPGWPENWKWLWKQYDRYEFPAPPKLIGEVINRKTEFQPMSL